jgi:hypothetical protein
MTIAWSDWRQFPDSHSGMPFAPASGPGVFEVRHVTSGEQVAFATSANLASSLSTLITPPASGLRSIFARKRIAHRPRDLEYRACMTTSLSEARDEMDRLNGLRRAYFQRRRAAGA